MLWSCVSGLQPEYLGEYDRGSVYGCGRTDLLIVYILDAFG